MGMRTKWLLDDCYQVKQKTVVFVCRSILNEFVMHMFLLLCYSGQIDDIRRLSNALQFSVRPEGGRGGGTRHEYATLVEETGEGWQR